MTTDEEIAALKEAIREAHECIRDLRTEIKNADRAGTKLMEDLLAVWNSGVDDTVKKGLEAYQTSLLEAINEAQEAVFNRFAMIVDELLGEDAASRRSGQPSITQMLREIREARD